MRSPRLRVIRTSPSRPSVAEDAADVQAETDLIAWHRMGGDGRDGPTSHRRAAPYAAAIGSTVAVQSHIRTR
jgi:hypothetical protein